jgi:hypothetical protein
MPESFDGLGGEDLTLVRARAAEARDHLDAAKNSEFLQALRGAPRWDHWLAENETSYGDA